MKETYLVLMEKALSAYTDEHIQRYFNDVRENGLTEHGFPRLTVNIGILIAHGKRKDLLSIFLEMMDFCCKTIPTVKAANDFSVREVICCLWEIEKSGTVSKENTERWRRDLATIDPTTCYTRFATSPTDYYRNWVLFTAVSEYFRQKAGLCDSAEFIDFQLQQQLQWFDENGMYRDNRHAENHQPIMYDLVSRGLLALLLDQGYRGRYYETVDGILKKAGLLTLLMQSPNGEMAFGGRSNQFLNNEPWMIAVFEYEAKRYTKEGNAPLAAKFKAASARALAVTRAWLDKEPIRHIKNRFPTETKYGCEGYAYFDKYMITVASNLWVAYLIGDGENSYATEKDHTPCVWETAPHFHKLFAKAEGYGLEFDLDADTLYDANGLGRIHFEDAPASICISSPCPATPGYSLDIEKPIAFSACSAIKRADGWEFGAAPECRREVKEVCTTHHSARMELVCGFADGTQVKESYAVGADGVSVTMQGEGEIGFALPAFAFDGEKHPEISVDEHSVSIAYEGWICRYTTDGRILDLQRMAANRNGHYRVFLATAEDILNVKIEILKA